MDKQSIITLLLDTEKLLNALWWFDYEIVHDEEIEFEEDSPANVILLGLVMIGKHKTTGLLDQDGSFLLSNTDCQLFEHTHGASHVTLSNVWKDLQTTDVEEALITKEEGTVCLNHFLMACYFLTHLPEDNVLQACMDKKWIWFFVEKIMALRDDFRVDGDIQIGSSIKITPMMNKFQSISKPFSHEDGQYKKCFGAVLVICQYQLYYAI